MSHVATVADVTIKSIPAIQKACKELGLEFREGQKKFKWFGRWVNDYSAQDAAYKNGIKPEDYGNCEHAIGVLGNKTAYEIGLMKHADGGWKMVYDNYNGGYGLEKLAGKKCSRLVDEYSKEVMLEQAKMQGYNASVQVLDGGGYEVLLTQY